MNSSVLRKSLSTTSLIAVAAVLAACSGQMERFGEPGTGYTSNQQEIFTNSVRSGSVGVAANQSMPAPITSSNQQAWGQSQTPVYSSPNTVPVVTANRSTPTNLTTSSISRNTPVPVQTQSLPTLNKSASYSAPQAPNTGPVYVDVPSPQRSTQASVQPRSVQVPVSEAARTSYAAANANAQRDAILNGPPVVVSRFDSLPRPGPQSKTSGRQQMASLGQPQSQAEQGLLSRLFTRDDSASAQQRQPVDTMATGAIAQQTNAASNNNGGFASQIRQRISSPQTNTASSGATSSIRRSGQWTSVGGTMVTLRAGENIDTLSHRYGVPAKAIAEVNGLADPRFAAPGQSVLIPVYQQTAMENYPARQQVASLGNTPGSLSLPSSIRTPEPNLLRLRSASSYEQSVIRHQQEANARGQHQVMPGDSLSSVASRYNVSISDLARMNNLSNNSGLRMGQMLRIPQGSRGNTIASAVDYTSTGSIGSQSTAAAISQPARLTKLPESKPRNLVRQAAANQPAQKQTRQQVASLPTASDASRSVSTDASSGKASQNNSANAQPQFRWPVRGRIISGFGRKADGGRNDGINLSVPSGTSVRVAESGTVIYSGDELSGYGNLVLVKHANGWVTAYAHNEKVLVSKGQQVRRGQIIAQAGNSGSVDSPQLHFELRIEGDPVDPVPYLVES